MTRLEWKSVARQVKIEVGAWLRPAGSDAPD
jgi:hypothetical protein